MSKQTSLKIETKRLSLTFPSLEQIEQYHQDIIGTDMFKTIHWDGPEDITCSRELQDYWKECEGHDLQDFSKPLELAIIEKSSGLYVGGTGLRPLPENSAIFGLGVALAPKYHGQGFATEAVGALVEEAFRKRKAERVFACVFEGNEKSKRVMEKLGFLYEGMKRRSTLKYGEWLNEWVFAITRPDWEKNAL